METKNWIGGEVVSVVEDRKVVYNPSNLTEEVGVVHCSNENHVLQAETAAKQGFKVWSSLPSAVRGSYLSQMADALQKNIEELATLSSREMGKPIAEMKGEVLRAVNLLKYYAAEGVRSNGNVIPASDSDVLQYTKRVPLGVVGIITPWNFPVAIPIWKIAPALICGNTVIWKPAEIASLTATKMMEIFSTVQLPEGVLNLVIGKGSIVGKTLLEQVDIDAVSFTGSSNTGIQVASICAKRNIKYQTEMGGKNAAVVLNDANIEKTVPIILSGAYRSAGQKCTATSRIIVESNVYENFVGQMERAVSELVTGNALNASSYLGPVASKEQFDSVSAYINQARTEAEIIGEGMSSIESEGFYISPMLATGVDPKHTLVQEEVFGPLAVVLKAQDFEDAMHLCNETVYGLSASVFTNNLSKAHRFLDESDAGMVRVNQETAGVEYQAPFGGMKQSSSHSREQGQAALDFYTSIKTCAIKYSF
ncbi:aldehyde dehydrogenase family protein [Cytobacillus sp. IB215316]|uniref:aldehyde dehydrogenase family protein n=1 Tax=Cytobacillus sp. IB215316 TaxID=3097354 RepID=UPI002A16F9AF|nr:aldehyde dehydrogenase family protein [Cytobacillus sp. IB215316]MDX8361883.1 aldehyde dehydrogenase family protein [Cytobacillus sp. IB215316]